MHILLVTTQKPDSTGSGVYLTQLARAFVGAGHKVALVAGTAPGDTPELPNGVMFSPVRYETPALPFPVCGMSDVMPYAATRYSEMTPAMVAQLTGAFDAAIGDVIAAGFTPDLCICNHLYLLTAHIASCGLPFPVYAICHGSDLRQYRKNPLEHDAIRAGLHQLAGAFALHDEQAATIHEHFGLPAERVHVVGTGYDSEVFVRTDRGNGEQSALTLSVSADALTAPLERGSAGRLIFVGKIARAKGVPSLLRALALVPANAPVELALVGGAGSAEELAEAQQLAATGSHAVCFTGTRTPVELAALYNAADVFVLPSFYEGLPLVAIEALACGCKVVITELPGLRTWFERFAPGAPIFYVEPPRMERVDVPLPEDLPAFEHKLARAIQETLASDAAAANVEHLSWNALATRILRATHVLGGK